MLAPAAGMAAPTGIGNGTLSRLRCRTHELVDTEKFSRSQCDRVWHSFLYSIGACNSLRSDFPAMPAHAASCPPLARERFMRGVARMPLGRTMNAARLWPYTKHSCIKRLAIVFHQARGPWAGPKHENWARYTARPRTKVNGPGPARHGRRAVPGPRLKHVGRPSPARIKPANSPPPKSGPSIEISTTLAQ